MRCHLRNNRRGQPYLHSVWSKTWPTATAVTISNRKRRGVRIMGIARFEMSSGLRLRICPRGQVGGIYINLC